MCSSIFLSVMILLIAFCFIQIDLFTYFNANRLPVFLCRTILTLPKTPWPIKFCRSKWLKFGSIVHN